MDALAFCRLAPDHADALAAFFAALVAQGGDQFFRPHQFSADEARRIAEYPGKDLYCAALDGGRVLAYGLLRGWDQGHDVPSLGIAVHPEARGTGLARSFMIYLHAAARQRKSPRVRIKAHPGNAAARRLCESLGYVFRDAPGDGHAVGVLELACRANAA